MHFNRKNKLYRKDSRKASSILKFLRKPKKFSLDVDSDDDNKRESPPSQPTPKGAATEAPLVETVLSASTAGSCEETAEKVCDENLQDNGNQGSSTDDAPEKESDTESPEESSQKDRSTEKGSEENEKDDAVSTKSAESQDSKASATTRGDYSTYSTIAEQAAELVKYMSHIEGKERGFEVLLDDFQEFLTCSVLREDEENKEDEYRVIENLTSQNSILASVVSCNSFKGSSTSNVEKKPSTVQEESEENDVKDVVVVDDAAKDCSGDVVFIKECHHVSTCGSKDKVDTKNLSQVESHVSQSLESPLESTKPEQVDTAEGLDEEEMREEEEDTKTEKRENDGVEESREEVSMTCKSDLPISIKKKSSGFLQRLKNVASGGSVASKVSRQASRRSAKAIESEPKEAAVAPSSADISQSSKLATETDKQQAPETIQETVDGSASVVSDKSMEMVSEEEANEPSDSNTVVEEDVSSVFIPSRVRRMSFTSKRLFSSDSFPTNSNGRPLLPPSYLSARGYGKPPLKPATPSSTVSKMEQVAMQPEELVKTVSKVSIRSSQSKVSRKSTKSAVSKESLASEVKAVSPEGIHQLSSHVSQSSAKHETEAEVPVVDLKRRVRSAVMTGSAKKVVPAVMRVTSE